MCFTMRKNEVLVAQEDIEVYKVLRYRYDKKTKEKIFTSSYYNRDFRYELGKTYHEPNFGAVMRQGCTGKVFYSSAKGFYSWEDVDYALAYRGNYRHLGDRHKVVAKFIIPKGARYNVANCTMSGVYDEMTTRVRCSDKIKFVAWLSRNMKWITTPKIKNDVHTDEEE